MLLFIRSTREADWELHLSSLESMCKYFFAHDKQKYARLVPLYIAEMRRLPETDPDVWAEFNDENFVVNRCSLPFCAIGTDHGIEQVNRQGHRWTQWYHTE